MTTKNSQYLLLLVRILHIIVASPKFGFAYCKCEKFDFPNTAKNNDVGALQRIRKETVPFLESLGAIVEIAVLGLALVEIFVVKL